jgi:HEPN domain-containing protein
VSIAGLSTEPGRWLRYAREDLAMAERLVGDPAGTPRHVCMFAQQAAEKALGATLVFLSIDIPLFRHLETSLERLPADWQLRAEHPDLATLSRWSVEAQDAPDWTAPTDADAQHAVAQARAVWESVLSDLERHGFDVTDFR